MENKKYFLANKVKVIGTSIFAPLTPKSIMTHNGWNKGTEYIVEVTKHKIILTKKDENTTKAKEEVSEVCAKTI